MHTSPFVRRRGAECSGVHPSACLREDLNLHGLPHTILSRARLPFRHVSVTLHPPRTIAAARGVVIYSRSRSRCNC